jgi:hypothetical protein
MDVQGRDADRACLRGGLRLEQRRERRVVEEHRARLARREVRVQAPPEIS